jgi:hypothetical protein
MKTNLASLLAVTLFSICAAAFADDAKVAAVTAADDARVAAFTKADGAALKEIFSEDLSYAHSSGVLDSKSAFIDLISSGKTKYKSYSYLDRKFTFPAPGIALMTGKAHVQAETATGQMDSILSFLAVWREEGGKWKFLAWQSARLQTPAAK